MPMALSRTWRRAAHAWGGGGGGEEEELATYKIACQIIPNTGRREGLHIVTATTGVEIGNRTMILI